jgi:hypothetical protein
MQPGPFQAQMPLATQQQQQHLQQQQCETTHQADLLGLLSKGQAGSSQVGFQVCQALASSREAVQQQAGRTTSSSSSRVVHCCLLEELEPQEEAAVVMACLLGEPQQQQQGPVVLVGACRELLQQRVLIQGLV